VAGATSSESSPFFLRYILLFTEKNGEFYFKIKGKKFVTRKKGLG